MNSCGILQKSREEAEKIKLEKMSEKIIKLIYFHFMARAELSRLILAHAGVKYEDVRIDMDDWPNHKPSKCLGGSKIWNRKKIEIS
jgi:hypothetical protein